ncbi:transposase [Streptomyces sp. NBC_00846]|uniref:transposase n=1 Tax=Streptomyces sp. NBC_00846 TaxID=2975849 RepID=UPI003869FDEC
MYFRYTPEAGVLAPGGQEAWTATGAHQAAAERRHTLAHWRDVPERYGPWETVYGLFRRWQRDGTWHRIFEQLQARADAEGLITWDVSVDSTIARAHQHAARVRNKGICRSSRQVVSSPSPTITGSDAPGAGRRPSCTWRSSRPRNLCRWS